MVTFMTAFAPGAFLSISGLKGICFSSTLVCAIRGSYVLTPRTAGGGCLKAVRGDRKQLLLGFELKFSDCSVQSGVGLLKLPDVSVSQLIIVRISSTQPQPFGCSM